MEPTKNNLTNWKEKYLELYIDNKKFVFEHVRIYKDKLYCQVFQEAFIDIMKEFEELGISEKYLIGYMRENGMGEENV